MSLLTENYQKEFRREKNQRLLLSLAMLLATSIVIGIVFMLPTYFSLIFTKDDVLRLLKASEEVFVRKEFKSLEDKITAVNNLINLYEANEKRRFSYSPILASITKNTSSLIELKNVALRRGDDGAFTIILEGEAAQRTTLLGYIAKLGKVSEFEDVRSPITNLLKESNANFVLNIKIKPDAYKYVK